MLLAYAPMTGNWIAIGLLLALAVGFLHFSGKAQGKTGQRWLPLVAVVAGPFFAVLYLGIAYQWVPNDNHIALGDWLHGALPVMVLGVLGGGLGGSAIWLGRRLGQRSVD